MANYTITGVDPDFRLPGVPNSVRNVAGAAAALEVVREFQLKSWVDIQIIEHNGGKINIEELEHIVSKDSV